MFSAKSPKSNKIYYLHTQLVTLKSGRQQRIYYFKGDSAGAIDKLPEGYEVMFNQRTGLPMLRKSK